MTLKIEIEAHDLVDVLINAGIPDVDAKSLVFDILSTQNGIIPKKKKVIKTIVEEKEENTNSEEIMEDEAEDDVSSKIKTTRVSYQSSKPRVSSQSINFSNFGGNFNGIAK